LLSFGKRLGQRRRDGLVDPSSQAVLARLTQPTDDTDDVFGGFALGEDDLGKATAFTARKIDMGITQIAGTRGFTAQSVQKITKPLGIHDKRLPETRAKKKRLGTSFCY
jgi:hypothetical protein